MSDILQLQDYLFDGMLSCDLFNSFNIVEARRFLLQSEIEFGSIWQAPRAGSTKTGAGFFIEMPRLEIPKPNSLQRNLVISIAAIEERNINMLAAVGTLTSAEEMAEMALDFMFGWVLGFSSGLTPEHGAITSARDIIDVDGVIAYRASVSLRREHHPIARCAPVSIVGNGDGTYSLVNGANSPDATIYFTMDQSFPGRANARAAQYAGPISLASGSTITAAAWRRDLLPSHILNKSTP